MVKYFLLFLFSLSAFADSSTAYVRLSAATYRVFGGTAFMVKYNKHKYLVTNAHVCSGAHKLFPSNDNLEELAATILVSNDEEDICVARGVGDVTLIIGKEAPVSAVVFTAGYPKHSRKLLTFSKGIVKQKLDVKLDMQNGLYRHFVLWDSTLEGEPGCSGSAVVDDNGLLVGVINSTRDKTLSYLPLENLINVLKELQ